MSADSHLYDSQGQQQDGGGWVRSICVATFDVGTGHTLEEVSDCSGFLLHLMLFTDVRTTSVTPTAAVSFTTYLVRSRTAMYVPEQAQKLHKLSHDITITASLSLCHICGDCCDWGCWCVGKAGRSTRVLSFSTKGAELEGRTVRIV